MTASSDDHEPPPNPPAPQDGPDRTEGLITLDASLLKEVGLARLPPAEGNVILAYLYETLELRVGMRIAESMTDSQLDEFEVFIDANDEDGALRWLETNFPGYRDVVKEEFELVVGELRQSASLMLALVGLAP